MAKHHTNQGGNIAPRANKGMTVTCPACGHTFDAPAQVPTTQYSGETNPRVNERKEDRQNGADSDPSQVRDASMRGAR